MDEPVHHDVAMTGESSLIGKADNPFGLPILSGNFLKAESQLGGRGGRGKLFLADGIAEQCDGRRER
jgi:hypothetical protein